MAIGLLGRKVGMTQIFDESGNVVPVTVIEAGPCHVLQLRTKERDGYEAVQVGFLDKPRRLASRSSAWSCCQARQQAFEAPRQGRRRAARQGRLRAPALHPRIPRLRSKAVAVGQKLDVTQFAEVKRLDIIGTSKGRGTAGVMVRHNFQGQRASHGVKKVHRHAGSIGQSPFPGHVPKGRRMAGQHGNQRQHDAQSEAGARSTPKTICCWSTGPCPVPTAAT